MIWYASTYVPWVHLNIKRRICFVITVVQCKWNCTLRNGKELWSWRYLYRPRKAAAQYLSIGTSMSYRHFLNFTYSPKRNEIEIKRRLTILRHIFFFFSISFIKCVPRRGFGSAVCVQRDRQIVHIVSQSADLNPFRGTAGMQIVKVSAWSRVCM